MRDSACNHNPMCIATSWLYISCLLLVKLFVYNNNPFVDLKCFPNSLYLLTACMNQNNKISMIKDSAHAHNFVLAFWSVVTCTGTQPTKFVTTVSLFIHRMETRTLKLSPGAKVFVLFHCLIRGGYCHYSNNSNYSGEYIIACMVLTLHNSRASERMLFFFNVKFS